MQGLAIRSSRSSIESRRKPFMVTVTYPAEWEEIKQLADNSDYKAIMSYANYKETDPD
jgi:hypothetical protein